MDPDATPRPEPRAAPGLAAAGVAAVVAGVALALARAPWPDDWDGVGFVHAVGGPIDLARFRPHPPGYPAYVLAARALRGAAASDALAASGASALGGALVVLGAGALLARAAHPAWVAAALVASPLVAVAGTSVGADALFAGLLACALACAARARDGARWAAAAGALSGLALGARPSDAVVVVAAWAACAALLRGGRARAVSGGRALAVALASAAAACALWGAWLWSRHPGGELVALARAHLAGHFGAWGQTAATDPGLARRASAFARGAWVHALGGGAGAWGVARGLAALGLAALGARALPRRSLAALALAAGVVCAYTIVAQNVAEPRHVLAPACALAALAGVGLAALAGDARPRRALAATALALAMLRWPTAGLLRAHREQPPPGLALARFVRAEGAPGDAVVFGGRAARFAELEGIDALPRGWMGEVDATLVRADRLPRRVYLTDEVRFRERARGRVRWVRTFCRDARVARGAPCVALYRYEVRVDE